MMAALQQTSPQGGPNPNSPPPQPGGFGVSVADLPQFTATGGAMASDAANQRAYLQSLYQQRQAAALAPTVTPTAAPTAPIMPGPAVGGGTPAPTQALPAFDNSYVPPAPRSNPNLTGLGNALDPYSQTAPIERQTSELAGSVNPGISGAIYNWVANTEGGPAAQAYHENANAASTYANPDASAYFGQHPDLLTHAQKDPLGFAKLLGPILEAHAKEATGTHQAGPVTLNTADGPVVHQSPNIEKTTAVGKAFNLPLDRAHIAANPGMYSTMDYINAMRGHLSNNQVKALFEMHHYLNPQQQAEAQYLSGANASKDQPGGASYLDQVLKTITLNQNATLAPNRPGTEQAK